jgi:hypothetical protein
MDLPAIIGKKNQFNPFNSYSIKQLILLRYSIIKAMKQEKYSIKNDDTFSTKEKIQYTILGVLVLGGSFFIGRSLIKTAKANNEEKKTYEEGSSATYAKQIKMAFENDTWLGWGTDETALRKTIIAIPNKQIFRDVINSYQSLYNSSMMKEMQDELTTTEYNEMLAIIAAKPEKHNASTNQTLRYLYWAKRLKAAFDIRYGGLPGTDNDAIKAVFMEMTTQTDFVKTGAVYNKEYGSNLIKDLKSELEFWEYNPMMKLITSKPK